MADVQPIAVSNVVRGIYRFYRGISPKMLELEDVQIALQETAVELVSDLTQGAREQRTQMIAVTPELNSENGDWLITVPNAPDYIPRGLMFATSATAGPMYQGYNRTNLVGFEEFDNLFGNGEVNVCFYGSSSVANGVMVRINQLPEWVNNCQWYLSYRMPLYVQLQMGDVPPFPQQFIPVYRKIAAIACKPSVKDDSPEFKAWFNENLSIWQKEIERGLKLWESYRDDSGLPSTSPRPFYNSWRRNTPKAMPRAYFPRS